MNRTLISSPTFNPVDLDEIGLFLRIDEVEDNPLLLSFLDFAVEKAEAITGRKLASQQWRLDLERFSDEIQLPYPILSSVDSIYYHDYSNVLTLLDSSYYEVSGVGHIGVVKPNYGYSYPGTYSRTDAVQINFTCGYTAQEDIPEGLKNAIKSIVWHMYDKRGEKINDSFLHFLLAPYVLRGFV